MLATVACGTKMEEPVPNVEASYNGVVTVEYQGEDYDNENIDVRYVPSEDGKTADIIIYKIKFVPQMPVTIDVTIPGVPVTVTTTEISFSGNDITPLAMGGEYPRYQVTNLVGSIVNGTMAFSLNFGTAPTRFTGTLKAE